MTGCGQNRSSAAAQEVCEVGGEAPGASPVWRGDLSPATDFLHFRARGQLQHENFDPMQM